MFRFRAKREHPTSFSGLEPEKWLRPRPESGLNCLNFVDLARQRLAFGVKGLHRRPGVSCVCVRERVCMCDRECVRVRERESLCGRESVCERECVIGSWEGTGVAPALDGYRGLGLGF